MSIKTSWSTEDLKSLTKINNHKIMFDGYEYVWVRKLKEDWERHFICNFKNSKKAFSYLKYNMVKWKKELNNRLDTEERVVSYKELERMLDIQVKTYKIANTNTLMRIMKLRLAKYIMSVQAIYLTTF